MSEQEPRTTPDEPELTGHCYDGIEEYDNPMPGWWKWMFVGTIAWSIGYYAVVTLAGDRLSPVGVYERATAVAVQKQLAAAQLKGDAETLLKLAHEPAALKSGAAIFAANCAACHKVDGSGLVGPNLTDDVYINIHKVEDLPEFIKTGSKNLAMPAWGARLPPNDIVTVAAYVASLRGQNKPGKAPEGQAIEPWSK